MPRYFFHIKEGDKVTADEEGEEFDTLETVRKVAERSRDHEPGRSQWSRSQRTNVCDRR